MAIKADSLVKCRCGYSGGGAVHEYCGELYLTCGRCGATFKGLREAALIDAWNKRNTKTTIFEFNVRRVYDSGEVKTGNYQVTGMNRDHALINLGREFTGIDYVVDIID